MEILKAIQIIGGLVLFTLAAIYLMVNYSANPDYWQGSQCHLPLPWRSSTPP